MERIQRDSAIGGWGLYVCSAVREVEIHRRGLHVDVTVCLYTRAGALLSSVSVLARCSCAPLLYLRP